MVGVMVITEKVEVLAEIRLEEQQKGTGLALDVPSYKIPGSRVSEVIG